MDNCKDVPKMWIGDKGLLDDVAISVSACYNWYILSKEEYDRITK